MAVVNTKSTIISNYDAQPRVLTSGYIGGGSDTIFCGIVPAAATDSIGSTYRFAFIPSGVRIQDIQLQNDATTTGIWSLGVYLNDLQGLNLTSFISQWNATTAYVIGNVVINNGIIYACTTANTNSAPPSGNWATGLPANLAAGALPIPGASGIFGTGVSTAAANPTWKSVFTPLQLTATGSAGNTNLRVWELLGLTADPMYEFNLVATATTAPTAAGNIALQASWIR
jgi:hypothetical protein